MESRKRTPQEACDVIANMCASALDKDQPRYGLHDFARDVMEAATNIRIAEPVPEVVTEEVPDIDNDFDGTEIE